MADLGETSQADTAHKHKVTSWVAVLVMILSTIVLAFAFVLQSVPLGVVGLVVGIVGVVLAVTGGLMDDAH
jgi:lipopolysaccharide export LptBFGC system permease protein LptF